MTFEQFETPHISPSLSLLKSKAPIHFTNKEKPSSEVEQSDDEAEEYEDRIDIVASKSIIWDRVVFVTRLFTDRKFYVHRVVGAFYLVQWFTCIFMYFYDYAKLRSSPIVWLMPATGLLQSIVAALTFTFLHRNNKNSGYFSDKRTLSFDFVVENSFFAVQILFQFLYFDPYYYQVIKKLPIIEAIWVFMPFWVRGFWPRTTFRNAMSTADKNTDSNKRFFYYGAMITKTFYIFAKHYIGFFLNYSRFLDRISPEMEYHIYLMSVFGSSAVTIGVFLHTLKFKKYLAARPAFIIYVALYMSTFYSYARIAYIFTESFDLFLISFAGLLINFSSRKYQLAYQALLMVVFFGIRWGYWNEDLIKIY